eukprot:TRINITY_DN13661_c0_g1_i1.p2 TRINITY_DN13661_c0_g1~~TRINITY_DN13661_c0_g1_i1.p2  ORF type:complete len:106 (+),score=36.38 TRINITY_DN13661_c0_g1_i1:158-475(+)
MAKTRIKKPRSTSTKMRLKRLLLRLSSCKVKSFRSTTLPILTQRLNVLNPSLSPLVSSLSTLTHVVLRFSLDGIGEAYELAYATDTHVLCVDTGRSSETAKAHRG